MENNFLRFNIREYLFVMNFAKSLQIKVNLVYYTEAVRGTAVNSNP